LSGKISHFHRIIA